MEKIKKIYINSYLSYLVNIILYKFVPQFKILFSTSVLRKIWLWFTNDVMNLNLFKLFFDMEYISEIWYESFFYKGMTYAIRKISFKIEKSNFKFDISVIGIFFAFIMFMPGRYWSNLVWIPLFFAIALLFLSQNIGNRTGTVFTLVNSVMAMFIILLEVAFPYKAVISLVYLLISIDFFFLVSFSVRSNEDLEKIFLFVFILSSLICTIGFVQNNLTNKAASAFFSNGVCFGGILLLLFPFAFIYPMEYKTGMRRNLYLAFIFIAFWNVINATQSKAAFIGFIVEVAVLLITDIKLAPFVLFLMPLGLSSIMENFRRMWVRSMSYGNITTNIAETFKSFWNYGFGVNSNKFMSIYNSVNNSYDGVNSMINIPYIKISPVYKNIVKDLGAIGMFGFLYYILRLAHSSLTMLFIGDKKYKRLFSAGLAMLVGLSVSSFFEITLFDPRTLLMYWGMIGVLRAVRIISLGVY